MTELRGDEEIPDLVESCPKEVRGHMLLRLGEFGEDYLTLNETVICHSAKTIAKRKQQHVGTDGHQLRRLQRRRKRLRRRGCR